MTRELMVHYTIIHRGLAGTVLVYKIAGAMAKTGASLDEIYNVSEYVAQNVASIGVGLEHCHVRFFTCVIPILVTTLTFSHIVGPWNGSNRVPPPRV